MSLLQDLHYGFIFAIITGLLALYYIIEFAIKLKSAKLIAASTRLFLALIFSLICFTLSIIVTGTQGYKSLVKEEIIAQVKVLPKSNQAFDIRLIFNDGRQQYLSLKGDQLLIDAYILKWQSWANMLGMHTAYRLERASGRYKNIEQENSADRTVFAITTKSSDGIAEWREQYSFLSFLLDVENGSASFVDVDQAANYHLVITTNGLLMRPIE